MLCIDDLGEDLIESCLQFSICASSVGVGSGVLVDWVFLLIFFVCLFTVAMHGVICFIRSTVRLINVVKSHFLMACIRVCRTGLNSVTCYHLDRSDLVIAAGELSATGLGEIVWVHGMLVTFT